MRRAILTAVLLLVLLFSGCSSPLGGGVEELLEAPKLSQNQTLVVETLNRHIGGSAKLQYPRQGEFLSPFVFRDLNGDGTEEAVVFYSDKTGTSNQYVRVALLEQTDGKWDVCWDDEGLGVGVDSVQFGTMYASGTDALIVGYTNTGPSDKFLAVYNYEAEQQGMIQVDKRQYCGYALADFTGNGTDDLVVLSSAAESGPMQVTMLTVEGGELRIVTSVALDSLLQTSSQIWVSSSTGGYSLVIDGFTSGGTLASEQLYFDEDSGRLISCGKRLGIEIPTLTTRVGTTLSSRDVDGDGAVEIPVVLGNVSVFSTEQRMQWVSYYDFAAIDAYQNNFEKETVDPGKQIPSVLPVPQSGNSTSSFPQQETAQTTPDEQEIQPTNEKVFGLADLSYGYYLRLPISWKNRVTVERLGSRSWSLIDTASSETLLTVQILGTDERLTIGGDRFGESADYNQVATVGRYRIFVRVRQDAGIDASEILSGVMVLS
ncbi:MAG TPA: hypothetical protein H9896_03605 [Candidatus Pygmaiobacter gallistercoris]|nr:hypothetical protein [Candidatus Pygmaiobacter gallistercoris]